MLDPEELPHGVLALRHRIQITHAPSPALLPAI
jgi:hypothetical protein